MTTIKKGHTHRDHYGTAHLARAELTLHIHKARDELAAMIAELATTPTPKQ